MRVWGQILVFNTMSRLSNWRCEKIFVGEGETNLMDKTGVNILIGEKNMKKYLKLSVWGQILVFYSMSHTSLFESVKTFC